MTVVADEGGVTVKVQRKAQLIDIGVRDVDGPAVGRIAAVVCGPDLDAARWPLVQLKWRHTRVVAAAVATSATWRTGGDAEVPFERSHVTTASAVLGGERGCDHRRRDAHLAGLAA